VHPPNEQYVVTSPANFRKPRTSEARPGIKRNTQCTSLSPGPIDPGDRGYAQFPRRPLLKLSEKSETFLQRSLTGHRNGTFGSSWPLYTGQVCGRSVVLTPFRTVSLRPSEKGTSNGPSENLATIRSTKWPKKPLQCGLLGYAGSASKTFRTVSLARTKTSYLHYILASSDFCGKRSPSRHNLLSTSNVCLHSRRRAPKISFPHENERSS
jgi:hypothetical protein